MGSVARSTGVPPHPEEWTPGCSSSSRSTAAAAFRRGAIFVTNLALALTPAEGDEPEEDATTFTVSRIDFD